MAKYELVATAAFGLEGLVGKELKRLGCKDLQVENGKVSYIGDEECICKSNLWLRCADRVYIKLAEFKATTFEELFQGTKGIPWADYLPEDANFVVNAKSVKSALFSLSDIQSICKKAIVENLKEEYEVEWFSEDGSLYPILISILDDVVTILLDTSGEALHKRGYREKGSAAPLKETLAAALVTLSNWRYDRLFIDPFCGSGTLPIEAAMIARNIAPGLNRKFACEEWDFIISSLTWKKVRKEAYEAIMYDKEYHIFGYDIDSKIIPIARENAIKAGVDDCIHFQTQPMNELKTHYRYGTIVCNPPYGERLNEVKEVEALYKEMGKVFDKFETWSKFIITSYDQFEKCFGKKSDKNRKLYNGRIQCYYYQYLGPKPPRRSRNRDMDY
ncbi:class I SAM-dependent RNA methyltransferase [Clostridium botulinum C]|uniref:Class I SAM-dependent RNA methyltransferase n=2 Tax=Clostridium botulinum TaxID=1491 RepID=A0A9Q4TKE9_CLOBO|nr:MULTISPECIES: class I SAM-dependent RNA methyltransferase [Clostridium]EGO87452.1 N-6 DNA methylase [Clostridium botulinum C str. Stockholm]KEI10472.1 N-6 DNA methylase [Clostridium sp. K25]MCD3195956.1 class I SAM-dependent RNA methyltransferase [Clostridium botulinum C]MCD3199048.1 class I SAM-dependent RNA methyltransferase [Clostridium botulinum C]MCD3207008.1 class I SAM-dependent RNA methyltransferase [Clostridium botulinum C]